MTEETKTPDSIEITDEQLKERMKPETKKCEYCDTECPTESKFCMECSGQFDEISYEEQLGITITDEMIGDYITLGKMSVTTKLGKHISVTIRNLSMDEKIECNKRTDIECSKINASPTTYAIIRDKYELVFALTHLNNTQLPTDFNDKMEQIKVYGIELTALISVRVKTLHAAIGQCIQKGQVLDF